MELIFNPIQDTSFIRQIHFIVVSSYDYLSFINRAKIYKHRFSIEEDDEFEIHENGIKKALKKFGHTSALLSTIRMVKENCITKEKYEEMYKTNEESEKREDLSVGEDLETFIGNIKMGKFPIREDYHPSFLLCLLDTAKRRKLEEKDEDFMETFYDDVEADVPDAEWKESESNMKFAKFSCRRRTYFITQ